MFTLSSNFDHSSIEPLRNILLEIGPLKIYWYAVLILSGAMLALFLAIREGKRIGVPKDFLEDLVIFGLPLSIAGARLYYVIFEWSRYKNNLLGVFRIFEGGLAIHGAIITALIWGYFFAKSRGISINQFLKTCDMGAVGFLVAQAIGRWGNFMNQEAHGGPISYKINGKMQEFTEMTASERQMALDQQREFLSDKLHLPEFITNQMYIKEGFYAQYYHPTFLYESLWNLTGFTILLILRRTKLLYIGDMIFIYLIWYSIGRFFIEGMRTDSLYIGDTGLRTAQLISIVLVVVSTVALAIRHYKKIIPVTYYEELEKHSH
ncbi:prolipoprotein diacylglyceryl transferase [Haloplasma contractile]|uniref:Phosphatidylglycerol--prolipoprotein diacylglyceryl transferase n=1 Tax=Haloplasma contractile SSD-17B TaxID=1033810 RepID=U2FPG3_9MOLU|nr:prolipoprotein diacylglyceryl transferase [Haloplasma contractile]ERJ10961.1 Prolipoprotein diacylglyceryl transferase [Haloplasma contractile SSD-17B]ERJ12969.1 Prolipoprotein diacylglyceryl transferase [Haloplasma contractile SSD-17B]